MGKRKKSLTISTAAYIMEHRQVTFQPILISSAYQQMLTDGEYEHMVGQCALINSLIGAFGERPSEKGRMCT